MGCMENIRQGRGDVEGSLVINDYNLGYAKGYCRGWHDAKHDIMLMINDMKFKGKG